MSTRQRNIYVVRSVRRNPPDVRAIGRAILQMAMLEAEAERAAQNQQEHQQQQQAEVKSSTLDGGAA